MPPSATAISTRDASAVSAPQLAVRLDTVGTTRNLQRGERLFTKGDLANNFYKVVSGAVRNYKLLADGRRHIVAFYIEGDIFGFEQSPKHCLWADAVDFATIIEFRRCQYDTLVASNAAFGQQVVSSLVSNLNRAQNHIVLLVRETAKERIVAFLIEMAHRTSKANHCALSMRRADIADYLGLSRETVSRVLCNLERNGLITFAAASQSIVLHNKVALQNLSAKF